MAGKSVASGFTLFELVVTLALLSILAASSLPLYSSWCAQHAFQVRVQQFDNTLRYARFSAIEKETVVTVCPSQDHRFCSGPWSNDVIVRTTEGEVLRVFPRLVHGNLTWRGSLAQNQALRFTPLGSTAGQQGTFSLSDGEQQVLFTINHGGRVRKQILVS